MSRPLLPRGKSRDACGLFVGFSDDRRFFVPVLVLFVFFVLLLIIIGVSRRHRGAADAGDEAPNVLADAMGHVWTAAAVQEESDVSAKRSGVVMYPACFRLEDCLLRDAAAMAAGPDVIR